MKITHWASDGRPRPTTGVDLSQAAHTSPRARSRAKAFLENLLLFVRDQNSATSVGAFLTLTQFRRTQDPQPHAILPVDETPKPASVFSEDRDVKTASGSSAVPCSITTKAFTSRNREGNGPCTRCRFPVQGGYTLRQHVEGYETLNAGTKSDIDGLTGMHYYASTRVDSMLRHLTYGK